MSSFCSEGHESFDNFIIRQPDVAVNKIPNQQNIKSRFNQHDNVSGTGSSSELEAAKPIKLARKSNLKTISEKSSEDA